MQAPATTSTRCLMVSKPTRRAVTTVDNRNLSASGFSVRVQLARQDDAGNSEGHPEPPQQQKGRDQRSISNAGLIFAYMISRSADRHAPRLSWPSVLQQQAAVNLLAEALDGLQTLQKFMAILMFLSFALRTPAPSLGSRGSQLIQRNLQVHRLRPLEADAQAPALRALPFQLRPCRVQAHSWVVTSTVAGLRIDLAYDVSRRRRPR